MKIHGLRIYPQSVKVIRGNDGSPIFIHGRVSDSCSDFFYIFRSLASVWDEHFFANDLEMCYDEHMNLEDPISDLSEKFGSSFVAADLDSQLLLLRGDGFEQWGSSMYFSEGAFLPIFREQPTFELLKNLYWNQDFHLTSESWPNQMRAVLHMWDGIYWQLFTTERSDIDTLVRIHAGDTNLKMYFVDFDHEYPWPSNQGLQLATLSDET